MKKEYDSAAEWAVSVGRDEPHSLEDLQRCLQVTAPKVIEKAKMPWKQRITRWFYMLTVVLSGIGPIAGVTVFFDLSDALTRPYDFDTGFELVVAFLGFSFGIFFVVRMMDQWQQAGKYRDGAVLSLSLFVLACAVGAIVQAYVGADSGSIAITTLVMVPAFIATVLCLTLISLCLAGRAKPAAVVAAEQREAAEDEENTEQFNSSPRVNLGALTGDARTAVLKDRNHALGNLDVRGLLKGYDIVELRNRPLGSLVKHADKSK